MAYTALARKWRPRRFSEMVGQEHVLRALGNALGTGRVHHAFLFTGTRGVGKTTVARILAKCLNCDTGMRPDPCGECASCTEIDGGRFVDLIEVDAASRTKVDDTRELLDNVQYAPTRGRYKVYLIDEVHMLSAHSFNALLKTLEEPPPHVKFLLATTDPQKLPVTVLSRCLQFNLKRLSVSLIADRMRQILESEGIDAEPAGIRLVAQAADGSMRDGLSLLDQLIAFGDGRVSEEGARAMLGTIARDHVVRLAELLCTLDARAIVQFARSLEEWAPDYAQVLEELAGLLARVALRQVVADIDGDDIYDPDLLGRLAQSIAPEDVQLFYQAAITGRRDLALAPDPRTGFEMTLLRMLAFRPAEGSAVPTVASPAAPPVPRPGTPAAGPSGVTRASGAPAAPLASSPGAASGPAGPGAAAAPLAASGAVQAEDPRAWAAILAQLDLQGAARQLASHCVMLGRQGGLVRLGLDPKHALVRTKSQEDKLAQALSRYYGDTVRIEIEVGAAAGAETPAQAEQRASVEQLEAARAGLENDPTVLALKERFGAKLLPDTVKPIK